MLARLLDTPKDDRFWQLWGFDHQASHDAIRAAIQAAGGPSMAPLVIYPIPLSAMRVFLANNQQLHLLMNAAIGTQSSDLEDVDFKNPRQLEAWIALHAQEHWNVERALGLGT